MKTFGWFLTKDGGSALVGGAVDLGQKCVLGLTPTSEFWCAGGRVSVQCCGNLYVTPIGEEQDARFSIHGWNLTVWEVHPVRNPQP